MTITLRPLRLKDAQKFSSCINDPDLQKKTYDEGFDLPFTVKDSITYIRTCKKDKENPEFSILQDGTFVGTVSLDLITKNPKEYAIGYFIHPRHQGKGLATLSVREALSVGFQKFGADLITAEVFSDNIPSIRVLEKTGFSIFKTEESKGVFNRFYRISSAEWKNNPAQGYVKTSSFPKEGKETN